MTRPTTTTTTTPTTTHATIDPAYDFHAFSPLHGAVVLLFIIAVVVACRFGVRHRGTARLRRAERAAGWVLLAFWAVSTVYWLLPANFDLHVSLPLHMCDVTGLLAPLVLLTDRRICRTLLYFLGLGLSIHGVLTPILEHGWLHITFVFYWVVHLGIIGTGVYDVIARGYRPAFRDCLVGIGCCAIWLGAVLAVNLPLHLNYGYVGNITPERPTVIDGLGPWPVRVYKMIVAVIGLFVAMWLPWGIAARVRARRDVNTRTGTDRIPSEG